MSVIPYDGKRGRVWRIKYRDADGRQVMETVGAERNGITERKAEAELRERLVRVERKGYCRPAPLTFDEYATEWFRHGPAKRGWKASTVKEYRSVERRLRQAFGAMRLAEIRPRHVAAFVRDHSEGAATVGRDLALLHAIFQTAMREEVVESNPAAGAERPKLPPFRPQILEPFEVARVANAFTDEQARTVFLTLVLTGLRRSELQRLRWRDVDLVENLLRVRDSKSEDGIRSIALPRTLVDELTGHLGRSAFQGAGELVFCHPQRGTTYVQRRHIQGSPDSRPRRRSGRQAASRLPRPEAHSNHERRGGRVEPDRCHGQGWTREHGDDQAVPAPGRCRVPRRGRRTRAQVRTFYQSIYQPEPT
jgi:integrase